MVSVTAMQFPSTKAAIKYLHGSTKSAKHCGGGGGGGGGGTGCDSTMKKIKFSLGDERWGLPVPLHLPQRRRQTSSSVNSLFVRQGKFIVTHGDVDGRLGPVDPGSRST